MEKDNEVEKTKQIKLFIEDKTKFMLVVATVRRMVSSSFYGKAERALTEEDLVSELMEDALCNRRKWDMESMPDFGGWIITQAKSKISNLARKQLVSKSFEEERDNNGFDPPGDPSPCLSIENDEIVEKIEEELSASDEIGFFVFQGMLQCCSNQEIASDLQIEISEVEYAKKRIKRVIDRFLRRNNLSRYDFI
jgi:DNA-directed RNA polymerase specialized sigma24 family protein